jgi:hypothetical protein
MMNTQSISIVIVKKNGSLQNLTIKDFKEEDLFKKCGFKKADDFIKQNVWSIKHEGINYNIIMYGKIKGRANNENKYEFPPPIDNKLFFGNCCIVAVDKTDDHIKRVSLTTKNWENIYEKLYGGFEDLTIKSISDDPEDQDEMKQIPKELQTKTGYLKDKFVVDDSSDSELDDMSISETEVSVSDESDNIIDQVTIGDIGSELSEESYDTE